MTTTFETAKVGDSVYSLVSGWTKIQEINGGKYRITVEREGVETIETRQFDSNGRLYLGGDQVLFWDKPTITAPPKPEPKREAPPNDELVEVYLEVRDMWVKKYSAGEFSENGCLLCWNDGATSKTTEHSTEWSEWRTPQENEGWIEHIPTADSVCPVKNGTVIDVKLRNGQVHGKKVVGQDSMTSAIQWRTGYSFTDGETPLDIVRYRISR